MADYVSIFLIRVMRLENLQITDIRALNPFALTEKARIKSKIKVKKAIKRDSMNYKEL